MTDRKPTEPSRLALWLNDFGPVDRISVKHFAYDGFSETQILVMNMKTDREYQTSPREIGTDKKTCEVILRIGTASIVELTDLGRQRVKEWREWSRQSVKAGSP